MFKHSNNARIEDLENRLAELQMRAVTSQAIFGMIAALVLRSVDDKHREQIMRELRRNVFVEMKPTSGSDIETLALRTEEFASSLLDQIEIIARKT